MKLFKNIEEILKRVKNIEDIVAIDSSSKSKKQLKVREEYRAEIKELSKENRKLKKELEQIKNFYEEPNACTKEKK